MEKIIYTKTDEAPALATESLLPIIEAFLKQAGVVVETRDISLAGRILAHFPEGLNPAQRQKDDLAELGELTKTPEANIIKLPNISASIPQLLAAIKELKSQGYDIPDFIEEAQTELEKSIKSRYAKVLGSAVNPVLREGNSDRRVAAPVKEYAKKHPHSMGAWQKSSKSHVASMKDGDFYGSERSAIMDSNCAVNIEFTSSKGDKKVLRENLSLLADEVIDASVMSKGALRDFLAKEIDAAKNENILWSIHLKATMMKVSDPIIFGHAVSIFFADVFEKHREVFEKLGIDSNNGMGDLLNRLKDLPDNKRSEIETDIAATYESRPPLAMVDSDRGITNLHVPSDVIIDASMPAAIRSSGCMWGPDGKLHDTKFVIPDRSYAGVYAETINFCREHGAFDVSSMGNVANVGLMAQKAEEYGSHDKTFKIPENGVVRVIRADGELVFEHQVEEGDIWRMCQTKDAAIQDWVRLAVKRARATGNPAVFWLDENRGHDSNLITKVNEYLANHDLAGLDVKIMPPVEAVRYTLQRTKEGSDTISVTGNVLRDYLTDLFPILELGTSAKMLSIVPLLAGGGLYETGAGGSAPKHVQQFIQEGHLRWDSLGEFLALGVSLEDLAERTKNSKAKLMATCLNSAISKFLEFDKSPMRKVGQLDNRGSHFYLALYWAQSLAEQKDDIELSKRFSTVARELIEGEKEIVAELNSSQGIPVDIGGYYHPNPEKTAQAMRPSRMFNTIIDSLNV
ncbi:MAG: NADP-dependent isocitrate dehydrogenase [Bdellovibrionota bacterium]